MLLVAGGTGAGARAGWTRVTSSAGLRGSPILVWVPAHVGDRTRRGVGMESTNRDAVTGPGPTPSVRGRGPRAWRAFALAFLGISLVSGAWVATTPLGVSPDEPAHLVKAASVVRGELLGDVTDNPQIRDVDVPAGVASTLVAQCVRQSVDTTADCVGEVPAESDVLVEAPTSAGLYNPVYYVLVGWPTLIGGGEAALYAVRLVSALLCSALLASAVSFASLLARPALPVLVSVAGITPTTYFLNASVNPNAFEVSATAAFAAALAVALTSGRHPGWGTVAWLLLSGGLLVHARGLSPFWLGLVVVVFVLLAGADTVVRVLLRTRVVVAVVGVALSTVAAGVWTVRTGSLSAVGTYPGQGTSFSAGLLEMLERTFDYGADAVGRFGWLDTPAPSYVLFAFAVGLGALVVGAFLVPAPTRQARASLIVAVVGLVLVPAVVQASSVERSGYVWQGRYNLPAVVIVLLAAALLLAPVVDGLSSRVRRRLTWTAAVGAGASSFACLVTFLARNSVGASATWGTLLRSPVWSPPVGSTSAWVVLCLVVAVVLAAVVVLVSRAAGRGDDGDVARTVTRVPA